jgi:hypothetical protein
MKSDRPKKATKNAPQKVRKKIREPFHAYQKKDVDVDTALKNIESVAVGCSLDGHNSKPPNMEGISRPGKIKPSVFAGQLERNLNTLNSR